MATVVVQARSQQTWVNGWCVQRSIGIDAVEGVGRAPDHRWARLPISHYSELAVAPAGRRSRDIVDKAITALLNLEHRGAQGAEPRSGDGAGILIQVPHEFLREVVDFELPALGSYATGIAFLPQSSKDAAAACAAVEKIAEAEGLQVLGWRNVPTDDSSLGALSRDAMPTFRQVFMTGASDMAL